MSRRIGISGPSTDFLVVGGGVVGVSVALEARRRFPGARIVVLEKEAECGEHASGRNSGVLHAGFYYTADSLKARFTREGQRRMSEYCDARGLRINRCGKLVVARSAAELAGLDELARRARVNGVELHEVSEAEARDLEPGVRTFERALWSPSTASVDPREVMAALVADARDAGVEIRTNTRYLGRDGDRAVRTTAGSIPAGYVINAAGLYADRIALDFGFSERYRILPFRGLYLYADGASFLRRHVYPVPELRYPFLGVHFTVTVDGRAKIGPTALPAFWREHYRGAAGFRWEELAEIGRRMTGLLAGNAFDFRTLARRELAKGWKSVLLRQAQGLVTEPLDRLRWRWGRPGVRAQLLDVRERRLEMDFRCEGDDRSFHVLNAVSPAFTCALPFAAHVLDRIEAELHGSAGGARDLRTPRAMGES